MDNAIKHFQLHVQLIEDNHEQRQTMDEEIKWMMSRQFRCLFAQILIYFQLLHPKKLWESFKIAMLEQKIIQDTSVYYKVKEKSTFTQIILAILCTKGKSLVDFPQMKQLSENSEEENYMSIDQILER